MHAPSSDKPTQAQLVLPLIEAVRDLGGRAGPQDVAACLAERFALGPSVLTDSVTLPRNGGRLDNQETKVWERHVRFARQKAKDMGYIVSGGRGVWQISDEAPEALRRAVPAVSVCFVVDEAGTPLHAQIRLEAVLPTVHTLHHGDARDLSWIPESSIELAVTSCPYFDLKAYEDVPGQMGSAPDYATFLAMLEQAWAEVYRVLVPGGSALINVGDVARSRARHGRHHVLPLHADIIRQGTGVGFDYLNGIIWHKIANVRHEQAGGGAFLGKPNQPGGVIKSDNEYILRFRKQGGYRSPSEDQVRLSHIPSNEYQRLFRSVWDDVPGTRSKTGHPAPYPVEIPRRLISMFSFAGDTVLDPFAGDMTTAVAAMRTGRHSVMNEIADGYHHRGIKTVADAAVAIAEDVREVA